MMIKKLFSKGTAPLLTAAVCALFWACATPGAQTPESPEAEARSAVSGLARDYEARSAEAFFRRFDSIEYPRFEEFRYQTRQFLVDNNRILMDVIVDQVVAGPKEVAVRAHWNKSYVNKSGSNKLASGRCEFVFRRLPSGALGLANIHGASPF